MKKIQLALIQQGFSSDREDNIARSLQALRRAAAQGAELIVLPELHCTRYFCQTQNPANFDLAETIPGPTSEIFSRCAQELDVVLVISLFERRAAGLYHNTAVVIERDGTIAGCYRKTHIPDDPGYHEKFYFTPGDLGFHPVPTSIGKIGVLICWDQWFPEAARLMALAGAELLLYPTAIGFDPADSAAIQRRQLEAWLTIQRGHAIANALPLAAVNRIGLEAHPKKDSQGIDFWGSSFICGCQGEILAQAGQAREELVSYAVDLGYSEKVRRSWPFFRDRRTEAYRDLLKHYRD